MHENVRRVRGSRPGSDMLTWEFFRRCLGMNAVKHMKAFYTGTILLLASASALLVTSPASALTERECKSFNSVYKRALSTERRKTSDFDRAVRKLDSVTRRLERDVERRDRDNFKCEEKIDKTELKNQEKLDREERKRMDYIAKAAGLAAQALQCGFGFFSGRSCNADRYQTQANRLLQQALKIEQRIPQIRDQNSRKLANEVAKCQRKAVEGDNRVARAQARVDAQMPQVDATAVARDAAIANRQIAENNYNQCLAQPPAAG